MQIPRGMHEEDGEKLPADAWPGANAKTKEAFGFHFSAPLMKQSRWPLCSCIFYVFLAFYTPPILQKQMTGVEETTMIDEGQVEESAVAMDVGFLSHFRAPFSMITQLQSDLTMHTTFWIHKNYLSDTCRNLSINYYVILHREQAVTYLYECNMSLAFTSAQCACVTLVLHILSNRQTSAKNMKISLSLSYAEIDKTPWMALCSNQSIPRSAEDDTIMNNLCLPASSWTTVCGETLPL